MGSSVYGLAHHRGVQEGIQIGLKMAAEAAKQNRIRIATKAVELAQVTTPAVLVFVKQRRAAKTSA